MGHLLITIAYIRRAEKIKSEIEIQTKIVYSHFLLKILSIANPPIVRRDIGNF